MTSNSIIVVDTLDTLEAFLAALSPTGTLYIDLEGRSLSRHGSLDLMTILPEPSPHASSPIYIIDVHKLGSAAFDHTPTTPPTPNLRFLLEDTALAKAFWDVRNDSDALFAHFGIRLAHVVDVQILELLGGTRPPHKRRHFVCGLEQAVRLDGGLECVEQDAWVRTKQAGLDLFAPERGGSYDAFRADVLAPAILAYCANDVRFLPVLRRVYTARIRLRDWERAASAMVDRVAESQSAGYVSHARQKARSPWSPARAGARS